MKISCNIIRDMLPLYVDEVLSEDSKKLVSSHLESCDSCRSYYMQLKGDDIDEVMEARIEAADSLKKIKRQILKKRIIAICVTAVVLAAVMLGAFYLGFVKEKYVSYEDSGLAVKGDTLTATKDYCSYYGILSPDGQTEFIYITDTMYSRHRQLDNAIEVMHYGATTVQEDGTEETVELKEVYYLPENYADTTKIYGDKHTSVSLPYFPEDEDEAEKMVNELKEESVLIWERQ